MNGRVLRYFFSQTTSGVETFSSNLGVEHSFAGDDISHGDILEYTADGQPVRAWPKHSAPADIVAETDRQEKARYEARLQQAEAILARGIVSPPP